MSNNTKSNVSETTGTKEKKEKKRFHTFILYPESLPDDWKEILSGFKLPMAISPLHDKDEVDDKKLTDEQKELIKNGGKVYKKEHYHVIYVSKNPVTTDAVRKRLQRALGKDSVNLVQVVDNLFGMYEYLTHESETAKKAGKHVYDSKDTMLLNNFRIEDYDALSPEESKDISIRLIDIIVDNDIMNMRELLRYLEEHKDDEDGIKNMRELKFLLFRQGYKLRAFFDGNYQDVQRENKDEQQDYIDIVNGAEVKISGVTGEILRS